MINHNLSRKCDVPGCKSLPLYIEHAPNMIEDEGIAYCSPHSHGKAPNLADWIYQLYRDVAVVPWSKVNVR